MVSWLPGVGMVLFGMSFFCTGGGLPSGLASTLFLDKLSLLISFSSLGISSLNLKAMEKRDSLRLYCSCRDVCDNRIAKLQIYEFLPVVWM